MKKRPLCLVVIFFLLIQLILVGGFHKSKDLEPSFLEKNVKEGSHVLVTGTVYQREEHSDFSLFYLKNTKIYFKNQIRNESNILVYSKQMSEKVAIGNIVQLTGEVRFFENATNPGNFDRKFYYQKQGIHCSLWTEHVDVVDTHQWIIKEHLQQIREVWKHMLEETMGEYYGGCMSAILLGDKGSLDENVKELYQKSGIGHILAISGLHMSFLGSGFYKMLRKCGASFWMAGLSGSLCLILYTWMIGGGISAQRALIMFVIRVGADVVGRDYDLATSLSVAAGLTVWKQPLYLLDAGFLLSFGAILGIAIIYPLLEQFRVFPHFLRASISIQLVLLPILLYFYFEIPIYSLFLNLLIIPFMSVVLSAGVLGSFLAWFLPFGKYVFYICRGILFGYEKAAGFTMQLPFGRVIFGKPPLWFCIVYYVCLFGCCAYLGYKKEKEEGFLSSMRQCNWKKWIGLHSIVLLYEVFFCIGTLLGHGCPGTMSVTAVDVGQGDCFYIRTPSGKHFLVDGGSTSVKQVGKYRIEPFLKSQGVGKLDYVFVSHGDADHISGVIELLENQKMGVQIERLVFPEEQVLDEALFNLARIAKENGTKVSSIHVGEEIKDGKMSLQCLAPDSQYYGEIGNESSMVLELRFQAFSMLFTGDLEGKGEQRLIESGQLHENIVLKAGHHGSNNSSSEELLDLVNPKVTIFSAGKGNSYGHPHPEVIERMGKRKCSMYCTKDVGAIRIWSNGKKMKVSSFIKYFAKQ